MGSLQVMEIGLMNPDGFFQLFDVLRSALPESCLSLAVALFPLLRSGVYLEGIINQHVTTRDCALNKTYRFAAALSLWLPHIVRIVWVVMNLKMVLQGPRVTLGRRAHGII